MCCRIIKEGELFIIYPLQSIMGLKPTAEICLNYASYCGQFILTQLFILTHSSHLFKKEKTSSRTSLIILCFCSKFNAWPEQRSQVVGRCARAWRTGIIVTVISNFMQQATFAENTAGFLSTEFFSNGWESEPCFSSHIVLYVFAGKSLITKYNI